MRMGGVPVWAHLGVRAMQAALAVIVLGLSGYGMCSTHND